MQYFGISLPRTGTVSLYQAMKTLGYNSAHYLSEREFYSIHLFDFANDFPVSLRYEYLDRNYPGSKFIYTDRNVDHWVNSYEIHWKRTGHLTINHWDEYNYELFKTLKFDRELFKEAFLRHRSQVFSYFKGRDNLLVLDMPYTQESWNKLCSFVGSKVPKRNQGFPNYNGSYSDTNPWCPASEVIIGL